MVPAAAAAAAVALLLQPLPVEGGNDGDGRGRSLTVAPVLVGPHVNEGVGRVLAAGVRGGEVESEPRGTPGGAVLAGTLPSGGAGGALQGATESRVAGLTGVQQELREDSSLVCQC